LQFELYVEVEELKKFISKGIYPNINFIFKVAPISSTACERSFSAMHHIKNWTRTSMTQARFSNLSLLHIKREIVVNLDQDNKIDEYSKVDCRLN
jgi:hypothetical protein